MNSQEILRQYATEQGWVSTYNGEARMIRLLTLAAGHVFRMDVWFTAAGSIRACMVGMDVEYANQRIDGGRRVVADVLMRLGAGENYEETMRRVYG